jgi:peptidoglycan/LPS O-acetylase OafA/YrhL
LKFEHEKIVMKHYNVYRPFGAFRLLLAALVVCQHYLADLAPEPLAGASLPYAFGSIAVMVFFALSGFVISEAADQVYEGRPLAFLANRVLRIAPHFLLAVIVSMVLCGVFDVMGTLRITRHETFAPEIALTLKNISLNLLGFLPGADRFISFNFLVPAWAIRVEMTFYGLFALAMCLSLMGSRLGTARSVFSTGLGIAALVAPVAILATFGKAPPMFQYAPYFVYGCALYLVSAKSSRKAVIVMGASLIGVVWQFQSLPVRSAALGFDRAVTAEGLALAALMALMTLLAFSRFPKVERLDRFFGNLTFPLYMTHINAMIFVLSTTVGYSYAGLAAGLSLAVALTFLSRALVDPAVDRLRDAVRGRSLDRPAIPARVFVAHGPKADLAS